ncbi:hypothetical protein ACLOJK_006319 [Asimina triloba]
MRGYRGYAPSGTTTHQFESAKTNVGPIPEGYGPEELELGMTIPKLKVRRRVFEKALNMAFLFTLEKPSQWLSVGRETCMSDFLRSHCKLEKEKEGR